MGDVNDSLPFGDSDRFRLVRLIASGGMGDVFEVDDTQLGGRLALKTWEAGGSEGLFRFKREFRAVAQLRHRNLVRVHDLFVQEPIVFFTMEMIDGKTLDSHLGLGLGGNTGASELGVLRPLVGQILDALEHLHANGLVHRDLKPSNILVTPDGVVKLVDFGILAPIGQQTERPLGTPAYVAPETAAANTLVTPAADLYSLGVILHECLTGIALFDGDTRQVVDAHRHRTPPPLRQIRPDLPDTVSRTVAMMLRKAPTDRPTIQQIREALSLDTTPAGDTETIIGLSTLVGRSTELAMCRHALRTADDGLAAGLVISGPTGVGKSRLLEETAATARHWGFTVFQGKCHEREVVPYRAFDRLVDQLCAELQTWPLSDLLPLSRSLADAARVFTVLRLPLGRLWQDPAKQPEHRKADSRSARALALEAVARLFGAAARRRPVMLCVDDWHWSGPEDDLLLQEILRANAKRSVLVCVGVRNTTTAPRLPSTSTQFLELKPLSETDVAQALRAHGVDAPDVRAAVAAMAGGDLLLAAEVSRGAQAGLRVLDGTAEVLDARLGRLGPHERTVLELTGIARGPLPMATLRTASGLSPASFFSATEALVDAFLICIVNPPAPDISDDQLPSLATTTLEISQDRIRGALLDGLTRAEIQTRHKSVGLALELEALGAPDARLPADALYHHWSEAGEFDRAWKYGRIAAEEAAERLAWEAATQLYASLLCSQPGSGWEAADAWHRLAELRALMGNTDGATQALRCTLDALGGAELVLPDGGDAAAGMRFRTCVELAGTLVRAGHLAEGEEVFERLLATLALPLHRTPDDAIRTLTQLRVRIKAWSLLPDADVLRHEPSPSDAAQMLLFEHIFTDFAMVRPLYMAEAQMRFQLLARRCIDPRSRAIDRTLEAAYLTIASRSPGRSERAEALLEEASALCLECDDDALELRIAGVRGFVTWTSGRWRQARTHLESVVRLAMHRGRYDEYDGFMARHWLILACHYAGDSQRALELAGELVAAGPSDIVRYSRGAQLHVFRCIELGELAIAEALLAHWEECLPSHPMCQTRFNLEAVQLSLWTAQGRYDAVIEHADARRDAMRTAGCQLSSWHRAMWNLPAMEAAARRARADRDAPRPPQTLVRAAEEIVASAPDYEACLAHAWLALGADSRGDERGAATHLGHALDKSARARAPYHRFRVLTVAADLRDTDEFAQERSTLRTRHGYVALHPPT